MEKSALKIFVVFTGNGIRKIAPNNHCAWLGIVSFKVRVSFRVGGNFPQGQLF